ncbi:hypothetical protein DKX38_019859 [Salix brachista]|uniref:Uncharacterized protein n=1 Tax=Salix brachista TaxID=2182728 RepID=A0A5N5KHN3_9ROSI|nr:hypothetical protein DKX38_019859 [Salix brachista]
MDAMRKQLDVLMGANRNGDVREVNRKYYDRDVCRLYLVGLCPHELFQLTKMDMGPCPKVHSLQLRKNYEEARAKGVDNYDVELENVIDKLIVECDKKIGRALKRLEDDDAKAAIAISVTEVTQSLEVIELSKQIKEKLKEADQHGKLGTLGLHQNANCLEVSCYLEGKTDFKIQALEEVDKLRSERAEKQSALLLEAFNKDRASLPQPMPNPPPAPPMLLPTPDPRTQEMINEKLKKAEDLDKEDNAVEKNILINFINVLLGLVELGFVSSQNLIHSSGEQGMVDEAQKALEEAEALKKLPARQEPTLDSSKYSAADVRVTDQKLRVCDICGAFLSVYDSDRRLADHFGGKLHLGYMQIREKLTELQVNCAITGNLCVEHTKIISIAYGFQFPIDENKHSKGDRYDDRRSKERSRDRGRESSRDQDRGDSRDRGRDYDRRSRDHDRSRSRSREHTRDYDRHRTSLLWFFLLFAASINREFSGRGVEKCVMTDIKILLSSWVWKFVLLPRSVNLRF